MLSTAHGRPEVLLTTLINDVAAAAKPFILLLDDYHVIHTLPVHQLLSFLLEHQPPSMHLVIVSREDPPMPLSRLRAHGHLAEIRQEDLRFRVDEATELLRQVMKRNLSSREITALHQRTEGWIAGLHLAALSLRQGDDVRQFLDSFTGSHRYVLDFLMEEVFERQAADVRDFLPKTSILNRFTAALCNVITGRDDSGEVLPDLDQANLFIVPLDESLAFLREALVMAEPENFVRTFVDKGERMAELLREAAGRGLAPAYARRLLWAFSHAPAAPRPRAQPLVEPLSERELEVLHLLAEHKTNQQIAQTLIISVNTVKTHLKHI
jgi:LuxR family maltose regulon positive regulatory protein